MSVWLITRKNSFGYRYNSIDKFVGLEKAAALKVLYMSNNNVKDWKEVDRLKGLPTYKLPSAVSCCTIPTNSPPPSLLTNVPFSHRVHQARRTYHGFALPPPTLVINNNAPRPPPVLYTSHDVAFR